MKKNKKQIMFVLANILLTILCMLGFIIFIYFLFKINIIPTKYLVSGIIIFLLIVILLLYLLFNGKKVIIKLQYLVVILLE